MDPTVVSNEGSMFLSQVCVFTGLQSQTDMPVMVTVREGR